MASKPRPDRTISPAALVAATVASGACFAIGALWARLRASEAHAATEQDAMQTATEQLRRRNEQLTSLYNVFNEITETLSLRYVVSTTLRETQKIMSADMVVLRRLEGKQLSVIGAMADGGVEIKGLDPVSIDDDGPTSRAAQRGRSVRLDRDGELTMGRRGSTTNPGSPSSQTGRPPLESGVITPLIVGARVVGTMSCWSRQRDRFDADDERILEMMASSVATAIVASETVATSELHAHVDALTELPNRRQLNDDLAGFLAHLHANKRRAVVAMADIDHFKQFNDHFGHKSGDVALQAVAGVLRGAMRDVDRVYRYGGEEFVMIFLDVGGAEAEALADRLRIAVQATPLGDEDGELTGGVTISIGLACMPDHGTSVSDLIELADMAMYTSKTAGRNRIRVWQPNAEGKLAA